MTVDIRELKEHLHIDTDVEDTMLMEYCAVACSMVENYCRVNFDVPPEPVAEAARMLTGYLFAHRDGVQDNREYDATMNAVHAMLYPYRDVDRMF